MLKKFWKSSNRYMRFLWIVLIFLWIILFFSHIYSDILITSRHGINFWSILRSGKLREFYELNICTSGNIFNDVIKGGCAYHFLVYIIFAVWNLPLAIVKHFTGIYFVMNSFPCLIWMKLLPVLFEVLSILMVKKILDTMEMRSEMREIFLYLYASSILGITAVFITCQYDIIGVFFILLGIDSYIKKDYIKFNLFLGIAVCFKTFALILYIPLLLMMEKRIIYLVKNIIIMSLPYILLSIPFYGHHRIFLEIPYLAMIFNRVPSIFNWFVVVYIVLLVFCYSSSALRVSSKPSVVYWVCFVAAASFFGLNWTFPYWAIIMSPFIVLLIASADTEKYEINLLIEMVALPSMVLAQMMNFYWCFVGETMKPMLWGILLPGRVEEISRLADYLQSNANSATSLLFHSVFVGGALLLLCLISQIKVKSEL